MALDDTVKYFQIAAYSAAAFGIIFTSINYFNANKIKRGEWIKSLFEKFYESNHFKSVRKEIEYGNLKTFLSVDANGIAINQENEELLVGYLNFFEFLATLIKKKDVKKSEILDLFSYYINLLKKDVFIKPYSEQFYFKNLSQLLNEFDQ